MAQAVDPTKTTSPKVIGATLLGLLATIVTAGVAGLAPDAFAALGVFGPVLQAGIIAGATWLGGWVKSDPLRVNLSPTGKGTGTPDVVAVTPQKNLTAPTFDVRGVVPGDKSSAYTDKDK